MRDCQREGRQGESGGRGGLMADTSVNATILLGAGHKIRGDYNCNKQSSFSSQNEVAVAPFALLKLAKICVKTK